MCLGSNWRSDVWEYELASVELRAHEHWVGLFVVVCRVHVLPDLRLASQRIDCAGLVFISRVTTALVVDPLASGFQGVTGKLSAPSTFGSKQSQQPLDTPESPWCCSSGIRTPNDLLPGEFFSGVAACTATGDAAAFGDHPNPQSQAATAHLNPTPKPPIPTPPKSPVKISRTRPQPQVEARKSQLGASGATETKVP